MKTIINADQKVSIALMSVEIDWKALTEGPDGAALAETIRDFVHERFQHVSLPKLIRSVECHAFEFGTTAPSIVLKDICDPLPDFYENDEDNADSAGQDDEGQIEVDKVIEDDQGTIPSSRPAGSRNRVPKADSFRMSELPAASRGATPGMLGGTSNLGYFHLPLSAGLSGTATPLAAVAGAHFSRNAQSTAPPGNSRHADSFSSISPPSSATPPSRPASQDHNGYFDQRATSTFSDGSGTHTPPAGGLGHEVSPEDLQVVFHATYSGNVKLSLTAEVFLDYPMPSFVGIPLKLNITGLTFNGVGIMAYIKKRAHLCFLAPEDAEALIDGEGVLDSPEEGPGHEKPSKIGALLEDIKIESEMGGTDSGGQVLKNVGKIEKFVLEQVQRIFEDEFVYPSYWTFLV